MQHSEEYKFVLVDSVRGVKIRYLVNIGKVESQSVQRCSYATWLHHYLPYRHYIWFTSGRRLRYQYYQIYKLGLKDLGTPELSVSNLIVFKLNVRKNEITLVPRRMGVRRLRLQTEFKTVCVEGRFS
eukprot:snap_masked-scaffold_17-processed-gene-0.23-mRNA-1 protein AED:1.00 eAED:1.00 QI:0/0/0/0/1/1/2/0/126